LKSEYDGSEAPLAVPGKEKIMNEDQVKGRIEEAKAKGRRSAAR
jgi:hypothetical protein